MINAKLQLQLVWIQICLSSSKYRRESKQTKKRKKKKKRGEIHAELKVVEALNNSGQSNTQEKKMCSVLFN